MNARLRATSAESWRQLEALVDAALDLAPGERAAWVAARAGDDAGLREAALAWLRACETGSAGPLDVPVPRVAAGTGRDGGPHATGRGADGVPNDGDSDIGASVGAWRLLAPLGRGGMGVVHLAERADGELPMRVALKRLRGAAALDPHGVRRFREERRILGALRHPNIARLIDAGVDDAGLPWFAMELVEGAPLDAWCDARALGVEARLALAVQVCEAVAHAHRALVVHRDLKPSNVLVADDGTPKLLDFGIAKLLDDTEARGDGGGPLTRTGLQPMTPAYASPEQVRGAAVSTATDVYALGVLLYGLLAGRLPFGATGAGLAERILAGRAPRPSQAVLQPVVEEGAGARGADTHDADTPDAIARARGTTPARLARRLRGDLDVIVARAMHVDPARRYATADALAEDLRRHLAGQPVLARPDTAAYRFGKLVRRHPLGTLATAGAAAALLGLSAVTARQAAAVRAEAARAAQARDEAEEAMRFLTRTFARVDQHTNPADAPPSLREALDRAAADADTALRARPAVRARLLAAIAPAYFPPGEFRRQRDLYAAAVDAERVVRPPRPARLAAALHRLARAELLLGRGRAAERAAREALALAATAPGRAGDPAALDTLEARVTLQMALRRSGRLAEAEALDARGGSAAP